MAYKCTTPIDFKTPYFTLAIRTGFLCKNIEILAIFAFDVWGDTINTAARLESHGEPGKVHISEKTYNLIKEEFGLNLTQSEVSMKGKGMVKTYLV